MSAPLYPDGYPATPVNGAVWDPPVPPRRREGVRTALAALAVAGSAAVLGIPYALLWATLAPKLPVVAVQGGKAAFAEPEPEQWVADEGWFVFLGLGFGLLAALLVWWLARRWRGPAVLAGLSVGAVVGGVLAWWIGHRVGLGHYNQLLAQAQPGTPLEHPPALRIRELQWWPPRLAGVLLVDAFAAAVAYTLLAGWSRYATLRPAQQAQAAQAERIQGPQEISWGSWAPPGHPAAPERPGPGEAASPRD